VTPVNKHGQADYSHEGGTAGSSSLIERRCDGFSWAMLFNQRSEDPALPDRDIDPLLRSAASSVTDWPTKDLFRGYSEK
jgi:hypothetical protein